MNIYVMNTRTPDDIGIETPMVSTDINELRYEMKRLYDETLAENEGWIEDCYIEDSTAHVSTNDNEVFEWLITAHKI